MIGITVINFSLTIIMNDEIYNIPQIQYQFVCESILKAYEGW